MDHAETSTGVNNPVAELGALVKNSDTLFLVDSVAGLGGVDVRVDEWGIDAFYSGSQKCLSTPPGLAPASFSEAAMLSLPGIDGRGASILGREKCEPKGMPGMPPGCGKTEGSMPGGRSTSGFDVPHCAPALCSG